MLLGKQNIRDLYRLSTFEKRTVERFLRSLRVEFIYRKPRNIRSISEIEWTSASDYWFDTADGRTNVAVSGISRNLELQSLTLFQEYFSQILSRPLQSPDLPLLARFGKRAAVPLELLDIVPGQFYRGLVPDVVKQRMIQISGDVKPHTRFEDVKSAYDVSPCYMTPQSLTHICSCWTILLPITYGRVESPSSLILFIQMLACSHTPLWSMPMRRIKWWVGSFSSTKDPNPIPGEQRFPR